jgi:anti-sigma factor ChrR (cupin superfamily)
VLSGTFSDQNGDYQAGSYFRNPEDFKHAPFSKDGCILFIKLHQFQEDDLEHVVVDTKNTPWSPGIGGLSVMPLHSYKGESTALVKWPKGELFQAHRHYGGEEIFVISENLLMNMVVILKEHGFGFLI